MSNERRYLFHWLSDDEVYYCLKCKRDFDLFVWKHHCRRCGGIFCSTCSNHLLPIPNDEFVEINGNSYTEDQLKEREQQLHRVCDDCAKYLVKKKFGQTTDGVNDADIVDALEFMPGMPFKTYSVRVPVQVVRGSIVRVSLDNRVWSIRLPMYIRPGSVITVRAPFNAVQLPTANVIVNTSFMTQTIKCPNCTYENNDERSDNTNSNQESTYLTNCRVCNHTLLNNQVVKSSKIPRVRIVGFDEVDSSKGVKESYIYVPNNINPLDVFAVKIDGQLFHVVCPANAREGYKIIVESPIL